MKIGDLKDVLILGGLALGGYWLYTQLSKFKLPEIKPIVLPPLLAPLDPIMNIIAAPFAAPLAEELGYPTVELFKEDLFAAAKKQVEVEGRSVLHLSELASRLPEYQPVAPEPVPSRATATLDNLPFLGTIEASPMEFEFTVRACGGGAR